MSEAYGRGRRAIGAEVTVRPVRGIGVMQAVELRIGREKVRPSCQGKEGHSVLSGGMKGSSVMSRRRVHSVLT